MSQVMVRTDADVCSFAVAGKQYSANEDGMVTVEDADVSAAIVHGFRRASDREAALANQSMPITPIMVAGMDREALRGYLASRDLEVPARTGDMRAAVLAAVDEEADRAAGVGVEPAETAAEAQGDPAGEDAGDSGEASPKKRVRMAAAGDGDNGGGDGGAASSDTNK